MVLDKSRRGRQRLGMDVVHSSARCTFQRLDLKTDSLMLQKQAFR